MMYAKIVDYTTNRCIAGIGTNSAAYEAMGFELMDVEQAYNGAWYLAGYAPAQPAPTKEEQEAARAAAYLREVDPITCHIARLEAEEQTEEVAAEISALKAERAAKVAVIKAAYPYPEVSHE